MQLHVNYPTAVHESAPTNGTFTHPNVPERQVWQWADAPAASFTLWYPCALCG